MSTVLIEALSLPGHKQVEKVVLSKFPAITMQKQVSL
jgi:hypothetical protein